MNELVLFTIVVAATAYVAQPFWRKGAVVKRRRNGQLSELIERRDSLLAQIKELEFDYEVGKISDEDFAEINARYRTEAIAVLRRIDALRGNSRSLGQLESELRKRRARQQKADRFCSQCGHPAAKTDRFCSNCGNKLARG